MTEITRLRSLLFAPASRPDVLAKLPRSNPDGVVVDLEDAVPADAKADARPHANRMGAELAADNPTLAVYVRVNAIPTDWFATDIAEGCSPALTGIVVPKLESPEEVDVVAACCTMPASTTCMSSPASRPRGGVDRVREFLRPPVAACYFGAEDFIADMGGVRTESSTEVLYAALARCARGSDRRRARTGSGRQPVR